MESDPVARNFIVLIIGIVVVGFVLQYAFFRHNSPERRFTGFVVVFVGFVLAVTLINRVVF